LDLGVRRIGSDALTCGASKGSIRDTKVSYGRLIRELHRDFRGDSFASFRLERRCNDEIFASKEDVGEGNLGCHFDGGVGCTKFRLQDGKERFADARSGYDLVTLLHVEVRNREIVGSNHPCSLFVKLL